MSKYWFLMFMLLFSGRYCYAFVIDGQAAAYGDGTPVCIRNSVDRKFFLDNEIYLVADTISNGRFSLDVPMTTPDLYILEMDGGGLVLLFLAPNNTRIIVPDRDLNETRVYGNDLHQQFVEVRQSTNAFRVKSKQIMQQISVLPEGNDVSELREAYQHAKADEDVFVTDYVISWIKANPMSMLNTYLIFEFLFDHIEDTRLIEVANVVPDDQKANARGREIVRLQDHVLPGGKAEDFDFLDLEGSGKKLTDFRGKYVLLDFWASWCVPCIEELPNFRELNKSYKDKNLVILSISLDHDREKWLRAIREQAMDWVNTCDFKKFETRSARQFYVRAIPANVLIGPDGSIVTRNLRGQQLLTEISALLGESP